MRTFVTGATGFVGRHLCAALTRGGEYVVGLQRDLHRRTNEHPVLSCNTLVPGDISDISALERVLAEYEIDTVFHLAAQTQISTAASDPVGTFETNVRGTWNVLEACRRQKTVRIVVASSDKAYGRALPPYSDEAPFAPDRPYETSKACMDTIARTYAATYGMNVAVTRCVNLYGPGQYNWSTLIVRTIRRILEGQPPVLRGGGLMCRDWLYIDDAINGYLRLARSDYIGAMNFGTGISTSVREIVETILRLMDSSIVPILEADKHGEIDRQYSLCLAAGALDWRPRTTLEDGLRSTIEWVRREVEPTLERA